MVNQSRSDVTAPHGEFLWELSTARSQTSGGDKFENELMRLADKPLELHMLLQRVEPPVAVQPDRVRFPVLDLDAGSRASRTPAGVRLYDEMAARRPPSRAPEAFDPSEDDIEQAFTVWQEPGPHSACAIVGVWEMMSLGAAAMVLLLALMLG